MSVSQSHHQLQLPDTLRAQLHDFRRRVWTVKIVEAVCGAVFGLLLSYLFVFGLDRFWDTPASVRVAIFVVAMLACAIVPLYLHRWVWRNRRLEQLARLLSRRHPQIGDQLLGIIELVRSESEQARSLTLCQAAIEQVAEVAQNRDFRDAVPNARHRLWTGLAVGMIAVAVSLALFVPAAATNAWARFLLPWKNTPRYTFAAVEPLPTQRVVAHGESFTVAVTLQDDSQWRPNQGVVQLEGQRPVAASLRDGGYEFELPPQIDPGWLQVRVGDSSQLVRIEPTLRPELTSVVAEVSLPEYLGRPQPQKKDVRGGAISLVKGSHSTFAATASRKLSAAQVDRQPQTPVGATVSSLPTSVEGSRKMEFQWQDEFGLSGREPFTLSITGRDDDPPSLACEDLPRQKVVLDLEQLSFHVKARDDFGVRQVGLEWRGIESAAIAKPAQGERILAAGGNDQESLDISGTFSAQSLGIDPQPIQLRIFAEDYFPGRGRVYSPTYLLYVLSAEQHAIWLTEQLSKWHRQSLEVRDREMQLYETNKQLRDLSPAELDQPDTRRRIESQATAERANGRRLSNLAATGEDLVRQATRNPEFGVGHLEKWAAMLQLLKDISANRMPSVADLLKEAAQAKQVAANSASNRPPTAGQVRAAGSPASSESAPDEKQKPPPSVPQIVDVESTQQPLGKPTDPQPPSDSQSKPSLGLPTTTLLGGGPKGNAACPAGQKIDEAVTKQQDLLAEFDKIADELNRVLANLEGSTLVKRLKAASRLQYRVAGRIGDQLDNAFGAPPVQVGAGQKKVLNDLAEQEAKSSQVVSTIMDDMQSYFERRHFVQFKSVLDEMRQQDAIGSLRQLGDDIPKEHGLSIALCEFWSDNFDRWAEDLVDPASGGT